MKIKLKRKTSKDEFTTGELYVNDVFECYTLEDEHRDTKLMHETRIPKGTYKIKLRTFGGHHERYSTKFPDIHKGMLWLQDVPKFKDILIHIGNTDKDTSGCILVGDQVDSKTGKLTGSTTAYLRLYKKVVNEFTKNEVTIEIID